MALQVTTPNQKLNQTAARCRTKWLKQNFTSNEKNLCRVNAIFEAKV